MKKYDMEITDKNIIDSIEKDYLNRNKKLNRLVELINSLETNAVISIDGTWGSGKTVFVKQLELLNRNCSICPNIFNKDIINVFRQNFVVYYYNAWENDMHDSALLSIIYNLINDFSKEKNQIVNGKIQNFINFNELLKTISHNVIDLEKVVSFEDLTKEIHTVEEKKNALNLILEDVIPKDKKLVFIVDELDRCKPSFAVNMLETLKHYFNNDQVIFIVSTNNEQLSYTIKKFYGDNFDGYSYLNKFFDLIIELSEFNSEDYLNKKFNINKTNLYSTTALFEIINYFKLNMREINRLMSDFSILEYYFNTSFGFYEEDIIAKYIFLPYCLALKIKDKYKLTQFLNGEGYNNLEKFILSKENMKKIINKEIIKQNDKIDINNIDIKTTLLKRYNMYFNNVVDNELSLNHNKNIFFDTFSLLGDYTKFNS